MQALGCTVAGLVIAFTASWKMALALVFITPGNMLNGLMHVKLVSGMSGKKNEDLERAGKVSMLKQPCNFRVNDMLIKHLT